MTKIPFLICGYYGMDNAGDELILYYMISDIRRVYPQAEITVMTGSPAAAEREYAVRAVHRMNFFRVCREIMRCTVFVLGGGGLFQDVTGSRSFYYYVFLGLAARVMGKRTVLYAVEISPLKNRLNKFLLKIAVASASLVSVRNKESRDLIAAYQAKPERCMLVPDPVITRFVQEGDQCVDEKIIGIILRNPSARDIDEYTRHLVAFLHYCSDSGIKPCLLAFHKKQDMGLCNVLKQSLGEKAELFVWHSTSDILQKYRGFSWVVASRFHGLVLACAFNIPSIGIIPGGNGDGGKVKRFFRLMVKPHVFSEEHVTGDALKECLEQIMYEKEISRFCFSEHEYRSLQENKEKFLSRILKNSFT